MFNKKQVIRLTIGGGILFIVTFAICFGYFYSKGTKDPITPKDEVLVQASSNRTVPSIETMQEVPTVLPTTQIKIQVVDSNQKLITEKQVDAKTLLGATKEDIARQFKAYKVIQFDTYEVILQKQMIAEEVPITYSVVIQEGTLGILEKGQKTTFISLDLSEDEFSRGDLALFSGEGLSITLSQKIALQQQPYYIEQILQNYNE